MLALSSKKLGPRHHFRVLLQQGAALTFGHASPHTELHAIVQSVSTTLSDHGAVPTDHRGFALRGAADEQFVRVGLATPSMRNPRNTGFSLYTLHNEVGGWIHGGLASSGREN